MEVEDQVVQEEQAMEEEEELDYHMIDELQQHNIKFVTVEYPSHFSASDLNKLKEAGIGTITAVHQITKRVRFVFCIEIHC